MEFSKSVFAVLFAVTLSLSSIPAILNHSIDATPKVENNTSSNAITTTNEFKATFSPKLDNKATTNITNNKGTVRIMLTNEKGNILQERTITSENVKYTIDLQDLPKGTYFLQVIGQDKDKAAYQTYYVD